VDTEYLQAAAKPGLRLFCAWGQTTLGALKQNQNIGNLQI